MKLKTTHILSACGLLVLAACGSNDDGGDPPTPKPSPEPTATTLVFPENNTECNEGTVLNDTESTVTFEWNPSEHTDSYTVNLKNLNTGSTSATNSNATKTDITLLRGTPYEWSVVSKADASTETATSGVWKFYNQGPGIEHHAPFPADAVSPKRGAIVPSTDKITLTWAGSDVDKDIKEYEVFFSNDLTTLLSLGITDSSSFSDLAVNSKTVYYWQVTTVDNADNTSNSDIFEFRID